MLHNRGHCFIVFTPVNFPKSPMRLRPTPPTSLPPLQLRAATAHAQLQPIPVSSSSASQLRPPNPHSISNVPLATSISTSLKDSSATNEKSAQTGAVSAVLDQRTQAPAEHVDAAVHDPHAQAPAEHVDYSSDDSPIKV